MKFVDNFEIWAHEKYVEFGENNRNPKKYAVERCYLNGSIITYILRLKDGKVTQARCPITEDNYEIGVAVAYARMIGEEIPKENRRKLIKEFKYGEKFYYNNREYIHLIAIPHSNKHACWSPKTERTHTVSEDVEVAY